MTLTLGYWNIRGYGSAIRMLLRYVKEKYEDMVYQYDPLPNYKEPWYQVKASLGLDFPNLPYLIDGDTKLTQSHAIIRYLGRKFNLSAKRDPELAREDMIYFQLLDLALRLTQTAYYKQYNTAEDFNAELELLKKDLDSQLPLLEQFLKDGSYFTGNFISYVDFWAYEIVDRYRQVANRDCLAKFMSTIEALEPLKTYLASDEYKNVPIFGPAAKLGGVK